MKKSNISMLVTFFLIIPLTLFLGTKLSGRAYYFTSTLVIIEIIVPFLLAFEGRKPQARELVVIAVMAALAVAARVVIPIPSFKAIFAIIMLSGIAFGPEAGFMVGAISAFASNFFYGQGAYTPCRCLPTARAVCWRDLCSGRSGFPENLWPWASLAFSPCCCLWDRCWTPALCSSPCR